MGFTRKPTWLDIFFLLKSFILNLKKKLILLGNWMKITNRVCADCLQIVYNIQAKNALDPIHFIYRSSTSINLPWYDWALRNQHKRTDRKPRHVSKSKEGRALYTLRELYKHNRGRTKSKNGIIWFKIQT